MNRDGTTDTYTSNNVNEYTSIVVGGSSKTPLYDNAGNLTKDINGYTYEYDYENRLTTIKDSGSAEVAVYTYDALGRRIQVRDSKASVGNKYERFYYDGHRVLLETTLDDTPSPASEADGNYYIFGSYIDEVLVMNDGTSDHYFGHDHLYSPTVIFDNTGVIEERCEYDAYGTVSVMDAAFNARASQTIKNPYLFTGRRLDILDGGSLKIQYSRARYYDSYTGRFIQRAPLGIAPANSDFVSFFEHLIFCGENAGKTKACDSMRNAGFM